MSNDTKNTLMGCTASSWASGRVDKSKNLKNSEEDEEEEEEMKLHNIHFNVTRR